MDAFATAAEFISSRPLARASHRILKNSCSERELREAVGGITA
ncbi:MAG: hypothetical protein JWP60_2452 [Ramlibacter sp.]|nr:hypothetical protein [Ramlibacter sp.]